MRRIDFERLAATLKEAAVDHKALPNTLGQVVAQIERDLRAGLSLSELADSKGLPELREMVEGSFATDRSTVETLIDTLHRAQDASRAMCHSLRAAAAIAQQIARETP